MDREDWVVAQADQIPYWMPMPICWWCHRYTDIFVENNNFCISPLEANRNLHPFSYNKARMVHSIY